MRGLPDLPGNTTRTLPNSAPWDTYPRGLPKWRCARADPGDTASGEGREPRPTEPLHDLHAGPLPCRLKLTLPNRAHPMQSLYLDTLTWPEAEQALQSLPTVLVPLGARTKEHGHHLPLNNDWLIAEYLARRVADQCPVLVLPTLQYGHYPAFLEYPGSISIRAEAFRDTIIDICQSLAGQGAKRFYVLNTGISTIAPLATAREALRAQAIRLEYTDIRSAYAGLRRQVETQPAGTHADEIETSMMLYIAPTVVRIERATRDIHPDRGPGGLRRDPKAPTGIHSPTGAYGDPTLATVEKGKHLVEGMVSHLVSQVEGLSNEHVRRTPETLPSG